MTYFLKTPVFGQNKLRVATYAVLVAGLTLSGCGRFAANDGSLDYQKAKLLKPMTLPDNQSAREIYPLYPLPEKGEPNQLPLTNKKGNRYALPRPTVQPDATVAASAPVAQPSAQPTVTNPATAASNTKQPVRIALTRTEEGIPILQVESSAEEAGRLLKGALTRANYEQTSFTPGRIGIKHVIFTGERLLQYRNLGSVTTVVVTTPDSKLAPEKEAANILADIRAKWQ